MPLRKGVCSADTARVLGIWCLLFLLLPVLGQLESFGSASRIETRSTVTQTQTPLVQGRTREFDASGRLEYTQSVRAQPIAEVSDHHVPGDGGIQSVDHESNVPHQLQPNKGSLPPVRSLRDWKVESLVLLATVDGVLHARDRQTGEARWALEVDTPMIQTLYNRANTTSSEKRQAAEDFLWIVEPSQNGALYMYRPDPAPVLQKLGITVRLLAEELSPHAREDPPVVYTAEKRNTLYTIDARTGTILQVFSSTGSSTIENAKCSTTEGVSPANEECGAEGTLTMGRIEYTVNIQSRLTQKLICQLKYWEWSPNTRDNDLQRQYERTTIDKKYVYSMHDGNVLGFDHARSSEQLLFTKKLESPVIRVFDVVRAVSEEPIDYPLVLLPQPSAPTELKFHPQIPNEALGNVFVNCTKQGSWYAMSELAYPLVTDRATVASCYQASDERPAVSGEHHSKNASPDLVGLHRTGAVGVDGNQQMLSLGAPESPLSIRQDRTSFPSGQIANLSFPTTSSTGIISITLLPLIALLVLSFLALRKNTGLDLENLFANFKGIVRMLEKTSAEEQYMTPPTSPTRIITTSITGQSLDLHHDSMKNQLVSTNGSNSTELAQISSPSPSSDQVRALESTMNVLGVDERPQSGGSVTDGQLAEQMSQGGSPNQGIPLLPPLADNPQLETLTDSTETDRRDDAVVEEPKALGAQSRSAEVRFAESTEMVIPTPTERRRKRGARGGAKRRRKAQAHDQDTVDESGIVLNGAHADDETEASIRTDKDTVVPLPDGIPGVNSKTDNPTTNGTYLVDEAFQINDLVVHTDTPALGYGSHGTVVYRGHFGGREVAVKRMLLEYFDMYSHEVSLLQESDDHPNVIRYFCRQQNAGFLFIALELCPASLQDIVEKPKGHMELISLMNTSDVLFQIAMGVRHLHSLKIVHRDIKPQNILVAEPKRTRTIPQTVLPPRILISDFGLCKKLEGEQSSFRATTAHAAGTSGWRAPELLLDDESALSHATDSQETLQQSSLASLASPNGVGPTPNRRATRAIDIFSLGCVFFYVLSAGMHPFGDKYTREMNIIKSSYSLSPLEALGTDSVEAMELISAMLSHDPKKRPDANSVLIHPFFWSSEKRLNFLVDVSDHFEWEPREPPSPALVCLERGAPAIIGSDFLKKLDRSFIDTLGKQRKYTGTRMLDLLRALRNKKNHYQDMPDNVKVTVGSLPDGYSEYWRRKFPKLVMYTWAVVQEIGVQSNPRFKNYFRAPD